MADKKIKITLSTVRFAKGEDLANTECLAQTAAALVWELFLPVVFIIGGFVWERLLLNWINSEKKCIWP